MGSATQWLEEKETKMCRPPATRVKRIGRAARRKPNSTDQLKTGTLHSVRSTGRGESAVSVAYDENLDDKLDICFLAIATELIVMSNSTKGGCGPPPFRWTTPSVSVARKTDQRQATLPPTTAPVAAPTPAATIRPLPRPIWLPSRPPVIAPIACPIPTLHG